MATSPPALTQFGFTLGLAERTLTAQLRSHLAERNIEPETWYALRLLAAEEPGLARETLNAELASSRTLTADSARALLARLEADGLIRGDACVDLTPEGEALYESLREYIAGPTARLLGQFDAADIETTIRTLRAIAERAAEELAVSG